MVRFPQLLLRFANPAMNRTTFLLDTLVALTVCGCSASPSSRTGSGGANAAGGNQPGGATTVSGGAVAAGGGTTGAGGQGGSGTTKAAGGGSSATGGTVSSMGGVLLTSGGNTAAGGATSTTAGGSGATGGTKSAGGSSGTAGTMSAGGSKPSGGATSTAGATAAPTGGAAAGGITGTGGITSAIVGGAASTGGVGTGGSTCMPPPKQCGNQDYVQGCITGNSTTPCGGQCVGFANACQENAATKGATATAFACPAWMLFSDAMNQAAILDGNTGFNYAVVGHDVDTGGIDGTAQSTCCQCYQLVYDYPSPSMDRQALLNPDDPNNTQSGITPLPPPLIVQSFNTAATSDSFDVFMAAGGFGGNNACDPNTSMTDVSGLYFYTKFPADSTNQGTVKAATNFSDCKTNLQWVTTASLSTLTCQTEIQTACSQFVAQSATVTAESIRSCIQSNNPQAYYHLNWYVHAMKVECPSHLTEVTGCKLAPQGLPAVDPNTTTAAQAAANPII